MASFIKKAALPMLLLLFTMPMSTEGRSRRNVRITNNLDPYYEITLHCRSKNDDFGEKHLGRNGTFEFTFRPALWPVQTLFHCSFQWQKGLQYFDVYEDARDSDVCGNCWWSVRESGHICRFNFNTKQYDDCFAWKSS